MEEKINKGKRMLADKLDLPKEIVFNLPRVTVVGKNEITIENHQGILKFDENEIKIKTSIEPLIIEGNSFEILYIATATLIISGFIKTIRYGE